MSGGKIFVGRKAELEQFKKVLENPQGQAILVVGQAGMGKSMLVNEVVRQAEQGVLGEKALKVKCWSVSYQITPTDDINKTMEQILLEAIDAASPLKKKLGMTGQAKDKWRALFGASELVPFLGKKAKAFGDLLLSWGQQQTGNARTRFLKALVKLSDCMSDEKRAIFIIDPEKWMPKDSDHAWRLVVNDLPNRIKLIFPQRPDDALVISDDFYLSKKVKRVPSDELDVLDAQAIDDLIYKYSQRTNYSTNKLHDAVSRYKGHPYAIGAALELIEDGLEIENLPTDPRPVAIAEAQWQRICEKGDNVIKLFEAYAILEVGAPDAVIEAVSGLKVTTRKRLQKDSYLRGLLREEGYGKRIYHSILADCILEQIGEAEKKEYHGRAVEVYRKMLAEAKAKQTNPDALAAVRLAGHVLEAEGKKASIYAFADECTGSLLQLGLTDTGIVLSGRMLQIVDRESREEGVIVGNLGLFYRARGDLGKAEELHLRALSIAGMVGDLRGKASQYNNLGLIYATRGHLDQAERMHLKALAIDEEIGFLNGVATNYGNLALICQVRGDLDSAKVMIEKALDINEKLGEMQGVARDLGNLGGIYVERGEHGKAEEMYDRVMKINEKSGRVEGLAIGYNNLGAVYADRGDADKAQEMFRKSLEVSKAQGAKDLMAGNYENLGVLYYQKGELNSAEEMLSKSLEIGEDLGLSGVTASASGHLGLIHEERGNLDMAARMYWKALEISERHGLEKTRAIQCHNLGGLYMKSGDLERAEAMSIKFLYLQAARNLGQVELVGEAYCRLGFIYTELDDLAKAEDMHKRCADVFEGIGNSLGIASAYVNLAGIHRLRAELQKSQLESEKGLEYYARARDLFEKIGMMDMVKDVEGWIEELKK